MSRKKKIIKEKMTMKDLDYCEDPEALLEDGEIPESLGIIEDN